MEVINLNKLKEMMKNGVVTSIWESTGKRGEEQKKKLSIEDIDNIHVNLVDNAVSIQQGYNYTTFQPTGFIVLVQNLSHILPQRYEISVKGDALKDVLEMTNWEMLDSAKDTVKLFNELLMSANKFYRTQGLRHLVSRSACLTRINNGISKDGVHYKVIGTAIDNKTKFKTMEDVYEAVNQNYIENVISTNDNLEVK